MNDFQENSAKLKMHAERLLKEWRMRDILGKYGEVNVVGSVAMDLMTWRDIDIEVICGADPSRSDAMTIADYLYSIDGVRKISIIDHLKYPDSVKPIGLYIGIQYKEHDSNEWKVDIWLLSRANARGKAQSDKMLKELTPETRKIILDIKSQLHDDPRYRKQIFSIDIYEAVMKKRVTNLDDFLKYMEIKTR